jgi:WD40 repeat protein
MLTIANAHDNDVNVINWNKKEPLIVSGGDDGKLMIWDLRQFKVYIYVFYNIKCVSNYYSIIKIER